MDYDYIKNRPPLQIISVKNPSKNIKEICENLVSKRIYLDKRFPPVLIEKDLWTADPYKDRSWRFGLHLLTIIEYLIYGYEHYKDPRYMNKALDFLEDWQSKNPQGGDSVSEMAWHDHSTALRLIIICKFYEAWRKENFTEEKHYFFTRLVKDHCRNLADPSFYMPSHNHGLDQDIALYTASVTFDFLDESMEWKELSLKRFWKQLGHLIAEDGSYKEHSPGYVYIFLGRLFGVYHFMNAHDSGAGKKLLKILEKLLDFFIFIVQPNGLIPPIGDSEMTPFMLWRNIPEPLAEKARLLQKNMYQTNTSCPEKVYGDGGYAILRNKWEYGRDTVQAVFYSAFHSRVHKHKDDLSITLFGSGTPLLTDAGKFSYNYSEPGRQYAESSRAHNTVLVLGEEMNTAKLNIEKSGLTGFCIGEKVSIITGSHCLYDGVIHHRLLLYLKPDCFIVIDKLLGGITKTYAQNFLFYPEIQCSLEGLSITGTYKGEKCISLSTLIHKGAIAATLKKGCEDPLEGWFSPGHSTLRPSWSGNFIQRGSKADFATLITIGKNPPRLERFVWEEDHFKLKANQQEITVTFNGYSPEIMINGVIQPFTAIPQPKLHEEIKKRMGEFTRTP